MTDRRHTRIVPAPPPSHPRLPSSVLDVECGEDEDVVWHWTHAVEGRFVSGYSIVQRVAELPAEDAAHDRSDVDRPMNAE